MVDGERRLVPIATIDDLGDLRTSGALRTIDGTGLVAAPLYDPAIREGDEITLPDWKSRPPGPTIATGQPGALLLLRPIEGNKYRVETVVTF
jgi:hypothetical protein